VSDDVTADLQQQFSFWSGRSKRKSEVSNWIKIFGNILAKAT
jgi:hypothetical protein